MDSFDYVVEELTGNQWVIKRGFARQHLAVQFYDRLRYQHADQTRFRWRNIKGYQLNPQAEVGK